MTQALSVEQLLELPVAVDLRTAGQAFGMGATLAYELAGRGEFPVPVLRIGNRYRVTRAALLQALGLNDP